MAYTTIDKPTDFFESKIWTGNGSSQNISLDFAPNWVWIKQRSATRFHNLQDTIRGVGLQLFSNANNADNSDTANITAFNSDGYSLGSGDNVNKNSSTYVGWSWKAGTSFSNDASGTGIGSLDSTGTFNNTSGFSIVSYTGGGSNATVKHGMDTAPSMILVKQREERSWMVYHKSTAATNWLHLDRVDVSAADVRAWNNTEPTSSVFSLGTYDDLNESGGTYIAYCFAEKKGYSKFGSYTGNGNNDGSFIHLGFKPAFVMVKRTDATANWSLIDNKRDPFNVTYHFLEPNVSDDEFIPSSPQAAFDFCSQGFKCRSTNGAINSSGHTFLYMAFAENPFVTSTGIPATAR